LFGWVGVLGGFEDVVGLLILAATNKETNKRRKGTNGGYKTTFIIGLLLIGD
jgi:hypothetical protein